MKHRICSRVFLAMLVLGTATFLGACATTGMDRSVKTTNSIKDLDSELKKMIVQVDATDSSLTALVSPGKTELKKPFEAFTKNLAKLESEGKKVDKRIAEMRSNSTEYFAEWEKQGDTFTHQEMRELSAERRNNITAIYAQVPAAAAGVRGKYLEYLSDLKEVQKYLSTDLTPKGVETITPTARKAVQDLSSLKESIKPVVSAMDQIMAELYSGKK